VAKPKEKGELPVYDPEYKLKIIRLALEKEIEMAPMAGLLTAAEIVERSREDKVTH